MPQQSAATVADWLSIAKVDQLTQAALESLLACSFTDIEDVGAADPFCLDEVQSAIGVLAFEPVSYTHLDVYKRQGLNCGSAETIKNH